MGSEGLAFAISRRVSGHRLRFHLELFEGTLNEPLSKAKRQAVSLRKTPTATILEKEKLFVDALYVLIA